VTDVADSLAAAEREALADLLLSVGPEAPTLCAGWTARDLAAHLVVRQARPDAQLGIVVPPFAGWTERVRQRAARREYVDLVADVRAGPPWWNPQKIGTVDEATNALEYLVHHEDVRRAQPGWAPRELSAADADEVWRRGLSGARLSLRRSPVGIAVARPGLPPVTVREGSPTATVHGEPVEVTLWAVGRTSVADVSYAGDPDAVAALKALRPRL
jgi:uncharacterized protein (TIGR03085 family)